VTYFLTPLSALAVVTIDWRPVGNPGNAAEQSRGFGAVPYSYRIGTYDVTNSQYVEFLNAKDPTGADPLDLFSIGMSENLFGYGGIRFDTAAVVGQKYNVISGKGNHPVNLVNWYDAVRFANWLNNGQGDGDTETGAYTLVGGTPIPSNADAITRSPGAAVFLPSLDEWYKAAYYNPGTGLYFLYPTSSDLPPASGHPTSLPNYANYYPFPGDASPSPVDPPLDLTDVGAYSGTISPYGAFDMGGNVYQWNETLIYGMYRGVQGGSFQSSAVLLSALWVPGINYADRSAYEIGFRVASIPEPSSFLLASFVLVGGTFGIRPLSRP
jgi:formylglycine-generating enzyme